MVKIIADSTSCLPGSVQRQYGIPIVPQMIHFGEQSYTEGVDIDHRRFMTLLRESNQLPKTSALPRELFRELFSRHGDPLEPIICVHPSAELSGTVRFAETEKLHFSST
jgi:DegV family protein with EDD domain